VIIFNAFVTRVNQISETQPQIGKPLADLCQIYGITEILAHAGDYLQVNFRTFLQILNKHYLVASYFITSMLNWRIIFDMRPRILHIINYAPYASILRH
jgi:hypothetical protein